MSAAEPVTLPLIHRLLAERTGRGDIPVRDPVWLSDFRINCRMVDHFRAGRVFVAGDAAHIHSPTGGHGITTGVQDAANLAWKLARVLRGAPESLLDTYEAERLPKAKEVLAETDRTTTLFELLRAARPVVLLGEPANATDTPAANGLLAALDALDVDAYVVAPAERPARSSTARRLADYTGDFRRLYGLRGEFLCLVRPDGHLGLVQRPVRRGALADYLSQICRWDRVERALSGRAG